MELELLSFSAVPSITLGLGKVARTEARKILIQLGPFPTTGQFPTEFEDLRGHGTCALHPAKAQRTQSKYWRASNSP